MKYNRKSSWLPVLAVLLLLIVISIYGINYFRNKALTGNRTTYISESSNNNNAAANNFPEIGVKPHPVAKPFNGCPPEGDGGDPALNLLKNRTDEGDYIPVTHESIVNLKWPNGVENRKRSRWTKADTEFVKRFEGTPVSLECYIQSAKLMGPESCNCHGAESNMRDFHVWLVKNPGDKKANSIVSEVSPSIRASHKQWTTKALNYLAKKAYKVRISGWMLMDPEHPEQIGRTRATIWEIHPIMRIEVKDEGRWVDLDEFEPV